MLKVLADEFQKRRFSPAVCTRQYCRFPAKRDSNSLAVPGDPLSLYSISARFQALARGSREVRPPIEEPPGTHDRLVQPHVLLESLCRLQVAQANARLCPCATTSVEPGFGSVLSLSTSAGRRLGSVQRPAAVPFGPPGIVRGLRPSITHDPSRPPHRPPTAGVPAHRPGREPWHPAGLSTSSAAISMWPVEIAPLDPKTPAGGIWFGRCFFVGFIQLPRLKRVW